MNAFTQRLVPIEVEEPVRIPSPVPGGKGRTVMVKVPALQDPKDGEIYFGTDASTILDKAKARHMGVLAPQELAELRKRLGLTQKEIAEVLQIGEKTWSRWETGREIVSRSLNLLLMALYEGKIPLPWLREICKGRESLKPISLFQMVTGKKLHNASSKIVITHWSSAYHPKHVQSEPVVKVWSQIWMRDPGTDSHRKCDEVAGGNRLFPSRVFQTEEMPLGA